MAVDQLASMLDVPTSSRASSLPHWIGGEPQFIDWHRPPVGASLLAIAVDQLASMLNMPTSSRASSLPHWIGGEPRFLDWHSPPVGASLLAIAVDQLASMLNMPTSSRASSLPQFFVKCSAAGFQLVPITRRRRSRLIGQGKNTLIQIRPDIRPFLAIGDKPSQLLTGIHNIRLMGHQHEPGD